MKKKRFNALRRYQACDHPDVIVGSAAGIRREVCKSCGNVSVTNTEEFATGHDDELLEGVGDDDS